jgi:hypothetical protein
MRGIALQRGYLSISAALLAIAIGGRSAGAEPLSAN